MKLCTDCKWMDRTTSKGTPICTRPGYGERSPVNGVMLYPTCESEREGCNLGIFSLFMTLGCGPKAKYFEPKTKP